VARKRRGSEDEEQQQWPDDGQGSYSGTDWPSRQPSHQPENNASPFSGGFLATALTASDTSINTTFQSVGPISWFAVHGWEGQHVT
jgi:hypothetical protein